MDQQVREVLLDQQDLRAEKDRVAETVPQVQLIQLQSVVMLVKPEHQANLVVKVQKVIEATMEPEEPEDQLVPKVQSEMSVPLVPLVLQVQLDKLVLITVVKARKDQPAKLVHQGPKATQDQAAIPENPVPMAPIAHVQDVFSPRKIEFKEYKKSKKFKFTIAKIFSFFPEMFIVMLFACQTS